MSKKKDTTEPFSREADHALAIQQARSWAEIAAEPKLSKVPVSQEDADWIAAHWASVVTSNKWVLAEEAALKGAREVLEAAEDSYEESVEGWNRAAAMEALDKASEAYAVAKMTWEDAKDGPHAH